MSLDIALRSRTESKKVCGFCGSEYKEYEELYSANITHNLGKMASEAGIYEALWRPEELGFDTASQIIPLLTDGLVKLKSDPEKYKKFDSPNGWGLYIHFVPFVEKYLGACQMWPDAKIEVDR